MNKRSLPHAMRINPSWIIFGSIAIILVPFFVWASYANLDRISRAQGHVIALAKTQEIQSANDGVIEKICVKEGERVSKGQLLVMLERSQAKAFYDDSKAKVAALQASLIRLRAEVFGKPLEFPEEIQQYQEFIDNQVELYRRRQQALHDDLSALNESLKLAQSELDLSVPLLKEGDIGAMEVIRLKRQISDIKGQISNKRNKYFQDSQADMTRAEEELSTKQQELTDRTITLERTRIESPMDAIVKNILITTKGARVRPGDVIMELVPDGDELIVEAKLTPSDISFVQEGQKASVKLDAYDYSIYGIFHGVVRYISPDTLVEKTIHGERYYYRVLIALTQSDIVSKNGKKIEIAPGMTAQIDIITGNRSVLNYLAKPLIKTLSESFTER
ncbi:MAG TPA: HlyD family efflux transporter periplasmic adaptor subunit [Epsilonproteobacteria bacterium]|nr:HlyD family efflux transporter periplasmic adaptor subunit [Campylobacterota bacterium]